MAMSDLNQAPEDQWAARALFWTLHDMAHSEVQRGYVDEAAVLADRMRQLLPTMGDNDETAPDEDADKRQLPDRALARLVRHMQPHYADVKAAYREARTGSTIAPYDYIAQLIDNGQLTEPLHERAGWIIWNHLWHQHKRIPSQEARQALAMYLGLNGVASPSELHSRILFVAIRLAKRFTHEFDFAKFLDIWGEDNFMPEDWERNERKGKRPLKPGMSTHFPSLVEAAVAQYISFKKQLNELEYSEQFMALLGQAIERYPDKPELKRYLAMALAHRGDKERALELYRQAVPSINKFYVWHEIAGLFTHDLDMKTSALCQTLTIKTPENFTSEVHRELGWELAREGNMAAALCELEIYRQVRERNGWPHSWRYAQLRKRIPEDTVASSPSDNWQLYHERAVPIVKWAYGEMLQQPAIVASRFTDKQGRPVVRLALPEGKALFVKPNQLPDGNYLMVRTQTDEKGRLQLLTADVATRDDVVPHFGDAVTGEVRVLQGQGGKQYGFVEGCFVPGQLLHGVADGSTITVLTEEQPDGRRRATAVI